MTLDVIATEYHKDLYLAAQHMLNTLKDLEIITLQQWCDIYNRIAENMFKEAHNATRNYKN